MFDCNISIQHFPTDISNLAVIATQDSGSDYDVFSGSSSSSSDDDSDGSSESDA